MVPPQDYDELEQAGAEAIFPSGTVIADAAEALIRKLNERLGARYWFYLSGYSNACPVGAWVKR